MNEEQTKKLLHGLELLNSLEPKVEMEITKVDDDSSSAGPDGEEGVTLKILTLKQPLVAEGSIPNDKGKLPTIRDIKVYVAGDDVNQLALGLSRTADGSLKYEGTLKLDVSKPKYQMVRGRAVLTAPARIWLTSESFRRKGRRMAADNRAKVQTSIKQLYEGEGPVDMVKWMEEYEKQQKGVVEPEPTATPEPAAPAAPAGKKN